MHISYLACVTFCLVNFYQVCDISICPYLAFLIVTHNYVALIFIRLWNVDYIACVALSLLGAMADLLTDRTLGFC